MKSIAEMYHRVQQAAELDGFSGTFSACCAHVLSIANETINPATGEPYAGNELDVAKECAEFFEKVAS